MKRVLARGLEFGVVDQGEGPPLLFVHGFPLNHAMWNAQVPVFATDHRVLVPDLRGFGQSVDTDGTVTMEDFADDLAAILDRLVVREPVVYCGLSMGGYIAWPFVRKYRQRLRGLVLCDTRSVADSPEGVEGRLKLAELVIREGASAAAAAMLPKALAGKTRDGRPEIVDAVRSMMLSADPTGVAAALRGMAVRPDVSEQLRAIDLPTLVVVGADDVVSPVEEMRGIAAAIPGAKFVVIPDAAHLTPVENPGAFNEALAGFLRALA
jgi:3-oxoadipate enol-lactonase